VTVESLKLSAAAEAEIRRLAAAAYPDEGCGVLIGSFDTDSAAVLEATSGRNLSTDRLRDRYLLDPGDIQAADRRARARGLDVVGFWHSHPDHPARASATDSAQASGLGWPGYAYIIVSSVAGGTGDLNAFSLDAGAQSLEAIVLDAEGS
jgi:proteasome lid subunit RPN8/RPN11